MNLSGNPLDYVIVFWAGVVVSFSPCVYPLIPITVSILTGINTEGTRWRGLVISLIYVLGLAMTYCALGVFVALTGRLFGQIQNQPFIFFLVGGILVLFSLVLFDVIPLPALGIPAQGKIKVQGLGTVLLLGMSSGLVVGPCTAPVLGTLLLYVGSRQDILYGGSLLFVFSYGLGASLILAGTFSGFLSRLPKSGPWLLGIKRICGVVLLIIGEYFFVKAGRLME